MGIYLTWTMLACSCLDSDEQHWVSNVNPNNFMPITSAPLAPTLTPHERHCNVADTPIVFWNYKNTVLSYRQAIQRNAVVRSTKIKAPTPSYFKSADSIISHWSMFQNCNPSITHIRSSSPTINLRSTTFNSHPIVFLVANLTLAATTILSTLMYYKQT